MVTVKRKELAESQPLLMAPFACNTPHSDAHRHHVTSDVISAQQP